MIRGFYTAASGLLTQEKKLNTYANNVANNTTAGYKKDNLIAGTFGEHIAIRMDKYNRKTPQIELGAGVFMQVVDSKYTDHAQGAFNDTNRPFDLAVQGEGYFVVQDAEGNDLLTRNGQFGLDQEGYLILPGFGRVQGAGGDIEIGSSNFSVDRNGTVYLHSDDPEEEPQEIGRLQVVIPTDYATMEKTPSGLLTADNYTEIAENGDTQVLQGTLERSNVDMSEEMSRIIASQRGLQSASQLVKMYDEMNGRAVEQLGRVR